MNTILGLAGRKGVGKTTLATHLESHVENTVRLSFATPIKHMIECLLPNAQSYHYLYKPQLKEKIIPSLGVSGRTLAKTLGTDWGRNMISPDLWVRVLEEAHEEELDSMNVIIDDVRFPNEAAWIRSRGGEVWEFFADEELMGPSDSHISENLFDQLEAEASIENTQDDAILEMVENLYLGYLRQ